MTDLETAWLAGILEGEAYFGLQSSPRIQFVSSDKDIVERVAFLLKVECVEGRGWENSISRKQLWRAIACGHHARNVMKAILPLMGQRRKERIEAILKAHDSKVSTRFARTIATRRRNRLAGSVVR